MVVVAGLVLVAAALLVAGVAVTSWPWLVGSLLTSLVAAVVLFRSRPGRLGQRTATRTRASIDDIVWVVEGRARFHARDCPVAGGVSEPVTRQRATRDGRLPCSLCEPVAVG